jgi:hypothetical protein
MPRGFVKHYGAISVQCINHWRTPPAVCLETLVIQLKELFLAFSA